MKIAQQKKNIATQSDKTLCVPSTEIAIKIYIENL